MTRSSKFTLWHLVFSDVTSSVSLTSPVATCPNAPYGAWCFLTRSHDLGGRGRRRVSMHRLVLGAFWRSIIDGFINGIKGAS